MTNSAESALIAAALNLASETSAAAFSIPIPDTTPRLFISLHEEGVAPIGGQEQPESVHSILGAIDKALADSAHRPHPYKGPQGNMAESVHSTAPVQSEGAKTALPEIAILARMKYRHRPAEPEIGVMEDDFDLYESDIECATCVDVLIVRADAVHLTARAGELDTPALPEPWGWYSPALNNGIHLHRTQPRFNDGPLFTADQMREYGAACIQAAGDQKPHEKAPASDLMGFGKIAGALLRESGSVEWPALADEKAPESAPQGERGTPAAQWRESGEPDPHAGKYDGERAALCMGNLTDDELANAAFLNYDHRPSPQEMIDGTAHSPIAYMTAVKERIRWLSRKLESSRASIAPAGSQAKDVPAGLALDAKRYRWLRDRSAPTCDPADGHVPFVARTSQTAPHYENELLWGEALDSAVDAAIAQQEPHE